MCHFNDQFGSFKARSLTLAAVSMGFMLAAVRPVHAFTLTGPMTSPRYGHTATLLPNGKVLVVGGTDGVQYSLRSAELYDPATGTWSTTGAMANPRDAHTSTLLSNGKVLVAGGNDGT